MTVLWKYLFETVVKYNKTSEKDDGVILILVHFCGLYPSDKLTYCNSSHCTLINIFPLLMLPQSFHVNFFPITIFKNYVQYWDSHFPAPPKSEFCRPSTPFPH